MKAPSAPLTESDYERINGHLRALEGVHAEVQRAKTAGFDCDPEDQLCQQLKDRLAKIKAAYFPTRP